VRKRHGLMVTLSVGALWINGTTYAENIPEWWVTRGVVNTNVPVNDSAVANIGQLKQIAYQTWVEMTDQLHQAATNFNETDPQVGVNTTNYLPKWDGSALVSGSIYDDGDIGIGTNNPQADLHVAGTIIAHEIRTAGPMTLGAAIPTSSVAGSIAWSGTDLEVFDGTQWQPVMVSTRDHEATYMFDGDSAGDRFGYSVSGAGDVNGDGLDDLIVGAYKDDPNGSESGSARVFSGQDGSILYTFDGDSASDWFGISVSGAGDVNGDGFDDLIVGANLDDNNGANSGSARVFSGQDGSVLYTFYGDSGYNYFGVSVSGAGDVNGDGLDDLIVGAEGDANNGTHSGSARVFSGQDGSILYTFDGDSAEGYFGSSVSGAGDVNGDGLDDLIVGARDDDNNGTDSGSARVFSGQDGGILYTFYGDSASDHFGCSVSGAGDVNGDGLNDLFVGAYGDDNNGTNSGSARVFSGQDGSILYTFDGDSEEDRFGSSVSGAGDVNGDGWVDLLVGAYGDDNNGTNSGSARVFSGQDGSILYTFDGDSAFDYFGISVSGAGDVNGDGFADLIAGAYGDDNNGSFSGSARVFISQAGVFNIGDGAITVNKIADNAVTSDKIADGVISSNEVDPTVLASVKDGIDWSELTGIPSDLVDGDDVGFGGVETDPQVGTNDTNYLPKWDGNALVSGSIYDNGNIGIGTNDPQADLHVAGTIIAHEIRTAGPMTLGAAIPTSSVAGSIAWSGTELEVFDGTNWKSVPLQEVHHEALYTFNGESEGDSFGRSVSGAGDVNNDGFDDWIVTASLGINPGSVQVFSGQDGSVIYTFDGTSNGDQFGRSVSGAGDVNNDGFDDLIVGAIGDDSNGSMSGIAQVFSGQNGSVLYTFYGDSAWDWFGESVSGAGDVNGDGFADLIVGTSEDDNNGSRSGSARVFSGLDGSVLYTFDGASAGDRLGLSVSGAGDVNNDGFDDLVVGAHGDDVNEINAGSARVFSGLDRAIFYQGSTRCKRVC